MSIDFCYWDAKSQTDLLIIIINQSIVTTLFITTIFRIPTLYQLYRKNIQINITRIILIYSLIIIWGIIQSTVNFYSIVISLDLPSEVQNEDMIKYSAIYTVLSSFPGYIVQTLFITICYTFCKNLVKQTDIRKFPTYSLKFILILKIYYIVRLVIWFTAVILQILTPYQQLTLFSGIQFLTLINDSAIINIFVFLSIRIFINRLKHRSFQKLKIEYIIMFCCSIFRIIVDSIYIIVGHQNSGKCRSQQQYNLTYSILYNIIGNYFTHFLPIAVILKIYYYDHRAVKQQQNLIPRFSQHISSQGSFTSSTSESKNPGALN